MIVRRWLGLEAVLPLAVVDPVRDEGGWRFWLRDINNGVYRAGFATSQEAYGRAYDALFARLDAISARLRTRRYLMGRAVPEADVRLFTAAPRLDRRAAGGGLR
ncbi:MAG TPA: glutathione S-transferase C-terminal domain-containing protein [Kineosporiaceae bacterium]